MKNTRNKRLITVRDGIIIISLLFAAAAACLIFSLTEKNGSTAVIKIDGQIKTSFSLSEKNAPENTSLDGAEIEIKNGRIRIKSSDCPNKICVHTGWISEKGEKIVCLPKKLIIEIE